MSAVSGLHESRSPRIYRVVLGVLPGSGSSSEVFGMPRGTSRNCQTSRSRTWSDSTAEPGAGRRSRLPGKIETSQTAWRSFPLNPSDFRRQRSSRPAIRYQGHGVPGAPHDDGTSPATTACSFYEPVRRIVAIGIMACKVRVRLAINARKIRSSTESSSLARSSARNRSTR